MKNGREVNGPLSVRGTDDYLTARGANPHTGLITPITPFAADRITGLRPPLGERRHALSPSVGPPRGVGHRGSFPPSLRRLHVPPYEKAQRTNQQSTSWSLLRNRLHCGLEEQQRLTAAEASARQLPPGHPQCISPSSVPYSRFRGGAIDSGPLPNVATHRRAVEKLQQHQRLADSLPTPALGLIAEKDSDKLRSEQTPKIRLGSLWPVPVWVDVKATQAKAVATNGDDVLTAWTQIRPTHQRIESQMTIPRKPVGSSASGSSSDVANSDSSGHQSDSSASSKSPSLNAASIAASIAATNCQSSPCTPSLAGKGRPRARFPSMLRDVSVEKRPTVSPMSLLPEVRLRDPLQAGNAKAKREVLLNLAEPSPNGRLQRDPVSSTDVLASGNIFKKGLRRLRNQDTPQTKLCDLCSTPALSQPTSKSKDQVDSQSGVLCVKCNDKFTAAISRVNHRGLSSPTTKSAHSTGTFIDDASSKKKTQKPPRHPRDSITPTVSTTDYSSTAVLSSNASFIESTQAEAPLLSFALVVLAMAINCLKSLLSSGLCNSRFTGLIPDEVHGLLDSKATHEQRFCQLQILAKKAAKLVLVVYVCWLATGCLRNIADLGWRVLLPARLVVRVLAWMSGNTHLS